jgi:PAS domain S-box-containing protein
MPDKNQSGSRQVNEAPGRERGLLDAVLDSVGALVVVLDPVGRIVRFNRACEQATGYQSTEVEGRPFWDFFLVSEEVEQAKRAFARTQAGQVAGEHESLWVAKDGSQRLIAWSNTALLGEDGSVEFIIVTGADITERRQADVECERLLAENRTQREFLEQLMESAPVGIAVVHGLDHRHELVNPTYQAIPGMPGTQMVGRTIAEVFPDLVARGALDMVAEVYRTGQTVSVREAEASVGPDRERTYWNVDHIPLPAPDGQVERVLILAHEVTDLVLARAQAEHLAMEAQQRAEELDAVFTALADAVIVYNASGAPVRINQVAVDAYGLDLVGAERAELTHTLAIRHPDGRPMAVEELPVSRALRGQRVIDERMVLTSALGQELTILASAAPLFGGGSVSGAVTAWHDITEQAQMERALRESEEKLGKLFEILPVGISVLDRHRNIVKANPALSRILDLSTDELLHGDFRSRTYLTAEGTPFSPQDFPSVRAFDEQRVIQDIEIGVVKEDGELIWTSVSAVPVPFWDWKVVVVIADITERKHAEEALRRERDFTAAVLDTSGGLVVVLDRQGRIARFNRACEQATGYLFEEVRGRPFWDFLLVPEEVEPVKAVFAQLQVGQVPNTFENYWLAKDGNRRWIAWSNTVLAGESGSIEYVIGTGIDITQRRRAEEELQRALDESRQHQAEILALLDGARQVLEQHSFEDTARSIFDICKHLTGATAGYVALSSRDGKETQVLFLDPGGLPCTVDPELPMPIRGLRGQVYQSGRVAYENDFQSTQWVLYLPEGHVGVDNLLFAPLVVGGQVVGLLGLANKPGGFTENDARLTGAFGELVAIALHNSQLIGSLEASELRFRSVVETASTAIVTADSQGRIRFWNPKAERIFGYSAQEIVGAPLTQIMPERFQAAHLAGMQRVLSTGKSRLAGETVETIGIRKAGDEFPLEMSLATWKTNEGSFFTAVMHEITQRKRVEEALREANQSLETLIKASPLAIIAFDLDLNIRLWNPAAERIFGWSEGEVLGRPYPLVPETKQEELLGFLTHVTEGRALWGIETVRQRKDGILIDVSIWTAPLYDEEGQVCTVMAIIADISERKRAEEELRNYADQQAALYTVTSAVAATLDQDELLPIILDAVLPALEADAGWILLPTPLTGDPPRVVAQRGTSEGLLAAEPVLPVQECPIYQDLSPVDSTEFEPAQVLDCPVLAAEVPEGTNLCSLVCVPLCVGGKIVGVLKIGWRRPYLHLKQSRDLLSTIGRQVGIALYRAQVYEEARQVNRLRVLSELDQALTATLDPRKLAEVTLNHLRAHLDAPEASLLLLPLPTQADSGNQAFSPAQGWTRVNLSSEDTSHWQMFLEKLAEQGEPVPLAVEDLQLVSRHPELPQQWDAHGLVVPIRGEQNLLAALALGGRRADRPFSGEDRALAQVAASHAGQAMQNALLYDELRQLFDEHERTRAQLIQSEKLSALGRLAASVAHEINNPLQAIENYLTLVHEEMDSSQRRDKLDRYLEVVEGELERISDIVRRMRDFYRPAHERLQPTDLGAVLDSVLGLSSKELEHRHITVERQDSGDLPLIQANPDHLKQVFLNLILNAADAMPAGGLLRVRASLCQDRLGVGGQPQPAVRIEIGDTGHGMPPEIQAHLFEPFFTTKEQGAGLGLSVSYSIIEAHQGQISVTSEEGAGTTFSILLPVAPC